MFSDPDLLYLLGEYSAEELDEALRAMPPAAVQALMGAAPPSRAAPSPPPPSPLAQAQALDPMYRERSHLQYLSERLKQAVEDVENGKDRRLLVKMPPRMGKSQLTSVNLPLWLLHKHPDWKIGLISHSPNLAVSWGRQIRRVVEDRSELLGGIAVAKDAGAVTEWETTAGGSIMSRSPGQTLAGWGFKVLLVDDPVRDFAGAHSARQREDLWNWWRASALTRMEPPSLVIVVMTRWHEDDLMGRILSSDYEGDPNEWEQISFPAIAEEHDVLGRAPGEPLITPLFAETNEQALERWGSIRRDQGSYVWNALYQQRPSSPTGAIFNVEWFKFWTSDKSKVTDDGRVVYFDPEEHVRTGNWADSWDMTFKDADTSDYVVGQRWVMVGPNRYLITQKRGRWDFNRTLTEVDEWCDPESDHYASPFGRAVHTRLVEDKANGTAIMSVLKEQVPGLIPVPVTSREGSKEARARAESPTFEAGNVLLPLPSDPGNEWVSDYLSELREFPSGAHDDQVDATTQALRRFRLSSGIGYVGNPARKRRDVSPASALIAAAKAQRNHQRGPQGPARGLARPRRY